MDGAISLLKELIKLRWRSGKFLLLLLLLELVIIYLMPIEMPFKYYILIVPITIITWLISNNYDILFHYHRMAIVLEVDENNIEAINRAKRIVRKIEQNFNSGGYSKLIRVYPLEINKFRTIQQADGYLNSWRNKFDSIILAEIEYGKKSNTETFLVKSFSIISKYLKEEVKLDKTAIDLRKELNLLGSSTRFSYLVENELIERELVINGIKRLLLFYSGLCLIGQSRLEDSLVLFKSIYDPSKTKVKIEANILELNHEQIFNGRLKTLLTSIYVQLIEAIQFKSGDVLKIKLLEDAQRILNPAPVVYSIQVILARTYYEIGNRSKAEAITENLFTEFGNTEEVMLNRAFFAIIDNNPNKLLRNYRKLGKSRTDGIAIIALLQDEKSKYKASELLFEFAIAVTTFFYQDKSLGKTLLKEFIGKTNAQPKYRALRQHCIGLLKS